MTLFMGKYVSVMLLNFHVFHSMSVKHWSCFVDEVKIEKMFEHELIEIRCVHDHEPVTVTLQP
jgi:hypothetical protein